MTNPSDTASLHASRRAFLAGTTAAGAALFVPIFADAEAATSMAGLYPAAGTALGPAIRIDSTNKVTIIIGSTEMGQGIMTGLSQLVAAELSLDWAQVRCEHSVTTAANVASFANPGFGMQLTGGSWSIRGYYTPLRQAAAKARALLLQAANIVYRQRGGTSLEGWNLLPGGKASNGTVTLLFSELVATAATLPLPADQPLQDPTGVIGARAKRLDIPAKVDGSAIFGMDVMLPGMVFATTVHCPTLTGTVKTMPAAPTGITLVNLGSAVGVVGKHTWAALQAAKLLSTKIAWNLPVSTALLDTATLDNTALTLVRATGLSASSSPKLFVEEGDQTSATEQELTSGNTAARVDITYTLPMLAHAAMEVLNCTVKPIYNVAGALTGCELWVPTQAQQFVIPTVATLTGLPQAAVIVHTPFVGGGFGRKIEMDYVAEAVRIAVAVKKPVKLMWPRPQDLANDKYRPGAAIRVQASVNSAKQMTALLYRNVSPSINLQRSGNPEDTGAVAGAVGLPYAIGTRRIEYVPNATNIPLGYWRSVGESYNTFAVESAMDELATVAGVDPMTFRLNHLGGDARAAGVLAAVRDLSNWGSVAGQGVAFLHGFGSYIAVVAQVAQSVNATTGAVTMRPVALHVAIDCGLVINPDAVEAQLQGGIVMGIGAAMWQRASFANGKAVATQFSNYRVAKAGDVPPVSVRIVSSTEAPGGVGEPGVPCVAPALANAWARLTGTRLRSLPFYPGSTMGGL